VTGAETTDDGLLERARSGDRAAMESLLVRHQAQVYRFGLRMCRNPEDARDILQDTLLAMARGLPDFRGGASLSTWLYTIARSYCLKRRRRSRFAPSRETSLETDAAREAGAVPDGARNPEDALAAREVAEALEQAIGMLEPAYREVLVLRDVEGLTAPEVAKVLKISVAAVKSRLHRARQSVRTQVAPILGIGEKPPKPTCPDVVALLSRHLEGDIDAQTCADMERHLEACGGCRDACDSLRQTLALCRTAGSAVKVPAAVQESVKLALRDYLEARA
jgi:RNA polymerase sigma-70 factor (ECF subfamily)